MQVNKALSLFYCRMFDVYDRHTCARHFGVANRAQRRLCRGTGGNNDLGAIRNTSQAQVFKLRIETVWICQITPLGGQRVLTVIQCSDRNTATLQPIAANILFEPGHDLVLDSNNAASLITGTMRSAGFLSKQLPTSGVSCAILSCDGIGSSHMILLLISFTLSLN